MTISWMGDLGRGTFGVVKKARVDGAGIVAIKLFDPTSTSRHEIMREIRYTFLFTKRFVEKGKAESWRLPRGRQVDPFFVQFCKSRLKCSDLSLVMPLAVCSLNDLSAPGNPTLTVSEKWDVVLDLLQALNVLEELRLNHNDITGRNVFLYRTGAAYRAVLGDFGSASRWVSDDRMVRHEWSRTTLEFEAPEFFLKLSSVRCKKSGACGKKGSAKVLQGCPWVAKGKRICSRNRQRLHSGRTYAQGDAWSACVVALQLIVGQATIVCKFRRYVELLVLNDRAHLLSPWLHGLCVRRNLPRGFTTWLRHVLKLDAQTRVGWREAQRVAIDCRQMDADVLPK